MVHWWYHPPSYDEWLPAEEVGEIESLLVHDVHVFDSLNSSAGRVLYISSVPVCRLQSQNLVIQPPWPPLAPVGPQSDKHKENLISAAGAGGSGVGPRWPPKGKT